MATYTDPEPSSGAELISISQPLITGNFTYLKESYGKDHNFTSTSNPSVLNADGYHTVVHFVNQVADPAPNTGGQLYTKTVAGTTQLFYENEVPTITQLTGVLGYSVGPNGFTTLAGGVILQWGTVSPATNRTSTLVNFPISFPTACFIVLATPKRTSNPNNVDIVYINATTTANFTYYNTSSTDVTQFSWIAIGN